MFRGGVVLGKAADPAAGRLVLPAGPYLVGFSGIAGWKWSRELEVRVVVGGDPRFAGGARVVLPRDHTAAEAEEVLRQHEAELAGRRLDAKPESLRVGRETFGAQGIVLLTDKATVELRAAVVGDGETVEFESVELFAIQLIQESHS